MERLDLDIIEMDNINVPSKIDKIGWYNKLFVIK